MVDLYDVPRPNSAADIAERQRKHVAAVVLHNPECDTAAVKSIYGRRFPVENFEDRLQQCMRRGWVRRSKDGWVPTEKVQ
jgi:hypothetical protein